MRYDCIDFGACALWIDDIFCGSAGKRGVVIHVSQYLLGRVSMPETEDPKQNAHAIDILLQFRLISLTEELRGKLVFNNSSGEK